MNFVKSSVYIFVYCLKVTFVNSDCECVYYRHCKTAVTGEGIINIRSGFDHNPCPNQFEFCCEKKNLYKPHSCGYRNIEEIEKKNETTEFGEFPWMIAIFHKSENSSKHFYKCGGSLIEPNVVLTAAHCVFDNGSFIIRAGEWDKFSTEEKYPHFDIKVISKIIHPWFKIQNLQYDLALLFLETSLDLTFHVNTICRNTPSKVNYNKCFVNGWGKSKKHKCEDNGILRKIPLQVINRKKCQDFLRETKLGKSFLLSVSAICAGGKDSEDTCVGDGGSPLVCEIEGEDNRFQQVGVVSWGIKCGVENVPGVYADVGFLENWIEQELKARNFS